MDLRILACLKLRKSIIFTAMRRSLVALFLSLVCSFLHARDPFDFMPGELTIQNGALKGQSLKGDRRPVLMIDTATHKSLGLPNLGEGWMWVANFTELPKHMPDRKKFHIAAIPLKSISGAIEEVVDRSIYNPIAVSNEWQRVTSVGPHFHAQMMVEFSEDILLFDQEVDEQSGKLKNSKPVHTIRNMIFTVGAARPETFDPSLAISGAYRRISMFVGEGEGHRDLISGAEIKRFRLKLSQQKLSEMLKLVVLESTRDRVSKPYNAMADGCLSTTLRHLDMALFDGEIKRFPFSWPVGPVAVMQEFTSRGIAFEQIESIRAERVRQRAEEGAYGPDRLHPYTRLTRTVGTCASIMSKVTTKTSLLLSGER